MYGFDSVQYLELSTTKVSEYAEKLIISKISSVFEKIKPTILYLPFKGDVHSDHRIIFNAAYSCTKIFRYPYIKKILMMETQSETDFALSTKEDSFIPNSFVNISGYINLKLDIMREYSGELGEHPFPRSIKGIEALSIVRGIAAGCQFAESFMLLKKVD